MPQSTNLNKNPYYDDFSDSKNFYKVLFKPGVTVQTRELTTLQSILQNQLEKLGNAVFQKNSVVIPGGFAYDLSFYAVEVESTFKGIDVESYFQSLVGKDLTGKISNVTAKVEKVLPKTDSIRSNTTFYIKYRSSSSTDFSTNVFFDGEELFVNENIDLGESSILSGSSVAKTIAPINRASTSVASSAKIDDGVYFVRGYFVNVSKDTIILDQYSNTPSYRVGLYINEEIVDVNDDSSLYDNAQGFSNYAAPGADRFKISLSLIKKNLDDFNDENFIELFRIENGSVSQIRNQTEGSFITDVLARRTFDESGNYYVTPFNVEALDSLNDNLGNGGLYQKGDTFGNVEVSDDLGAIKVSAGKAYVKGYEIATNGQVIPFPKPRTTSHVESSSSSFYTGNLVRVNNVKNIPNLGLSSNLLISLYDQRLVGGGAAGNIIGKARVYDFSSHITSYQSPASQFNAHLFDIQTYSKIVSDSVLTSIVVGDYIKGNNSGASAFVNDNTSQTLTLQQVSGSFILGENLVVNGIGTTISIGTFTNYSIDDIKSFSNGTFASDTVLSKEISLTGPFTLSVNGSTGTITSYNGSSFASNLKVSDIIKYSQSGVGLDVFSRITSIDPTKNSITLGTVSTVSNVCSGNLGVSTTLQTIFSIKPEILQTDDPSLTAKLNNSNISNIDFLNSNIYTKVQYTGVSKSSTDLTLPSLSGTDYVYASYDSERYTVVNADGSIENLDTATLAITNGGKDAAFSNLTSTAGPCRVITTQIKSNIIQKSKTLSRCRILDITKTKYSTPRNAGLSYTSLYGTRVEDDQISLNTADVVQVHGIFESSTNSSPEIPWITISGLNSANGTSDDLIVGELVVGELSGAVAVYVKKKTSSQIYLINKNQNVFSVGETVTFSETGYTAIVSSVNSGDNNIVDQYILDDGQRTHFYDFGRLIKKSGSTEPSGRLTIFFDSFEYAANDYGDVIAVNSYPPTLEKNLIHKFGEIRNTDVIDVRPRVSDYNTSSTVSPFDLSSRNFNTSSNNPSQILSPYENFIFDYDYYLPRKDKLTLSKDGVFNVVLGDPSDSPSEPQISNELLDVATISSNAYIYNIKEDVRITLADHRRYTMSDIRNIDQRVSNLEYYTTLSLLESSTQNLLITDADGLNRFKCGFFVDEFNDYNFSNVGDLSYNAFVENKTLSAVKNEERVDLSLFYTDDYTPIENINLSDTTCSNLKITGNKLSLNYSESISVRQPFASKTVNVNPFNIITWAGNLQLTPSKDRWVVTVNERNFIPTWRGFNWFNNWRNIQRRPTTQPTRDSVSSIPHIRSRNINFTSVRLRPNTRFRILFDRKDLTSNTLSSTAFPKFIEISNNVGSFRVGETVKCLNSRGKITCKFRVCTPNHKIGPIDSPTAIFTKNPYNSSVGISSQYGTQSTFLNIDTDSLSREDLSGFWGKISTGNKLVGLTSKAQATVSDIRLISNEEGQLIGSIWVDGKDKFETGQTSVELVQNTQSSQTNGEVENSSATATYITDGTRVVNRTTRYYDPLAQTFLVEDENGIIPTSVSVYFNSKDTRIPVELQIREVSFGTPGGSDKVIPGLRKVLSPSQITTSSNASVPTNFVFDDLVRLPAGEYAIVLLSDSNEYTVWVSELGAEDISTANQPNINKIFITTQPSLGTLFKSQNGTTWVPSPLEDLKFTLNKASFVTTGGTARFYNSSDSDFSTQNNLPNNPITAISTSSNIANSGRHILVFHPNHGMNSANNKVKISGVESDILPVKLTSDYLTTNSAAISVASTSIFATFEGSGVSNANPGYIKISDEIIKYEGVGTDQLLNITRGVYGTIPEDHRVDDLVYKYEFNNVSLARINAELTILNDGILKPTLDSYYVQVSAGSLFPQTKTGGGSDVYATKNRQFSEIVFNEDLLTTFDQTSVTAKVRTISSTSVNGSEVSFVDKGFETIGINSVTRFDSPRMVASRVNEVSYLSTTNFIGNRSFTLEMNLSTSDANVSPLIDLTQNYVSCAIYSIDQPVGLSLYSSDSRVNSNTNDPHSFVHISNRVDLQQSAKGLKVILASYRNSSSDIRVLYKIFTNDSPDNDQIWRLFPGYDNLDINGNIIDPDNNSGRPDSNTRSSLDNEYLDYTFTIDNLPSFTGFQIKIVGSGTNQAYSPLIKDLRVIALK